MIHGLQDSRSPDAPRHFGCATWNIHRARGSDGLHDPARIEAVIADDIAKTRPDILALQEADGEDPPYTGFLNIERIEAATGLCSVHGDPDNRWGPDTAGFLGTILFLHPAFEVQQLTLVDLPGHYPRGAVVAEVLRAGVPLRIVATHLSLMQGLRVLQMRTLAQHFARRPKMRTLLIGDLNEWRPWGGLALTPRICGLQLSGRAVRSFPARRAILPLDRILIDGPAPPAMVRALDSAAIRAASDHRPVVARIVADPDNTVCSE